MYKKKRKLTLKQKIFVKEYLKTKNVSLATKKAGYACTASGFENLQNPILKKKIEQILEKNGVSDEKIAKTINDGLKAKQLINDPYQKKMIKYKDHANRARFVDIACKLKGHLKPQSVDITVNQLTIEEREVKYNQIKQYLLDNKTDDNIIDIVPTASNNNMPISNNP